jgi:hypothetical protein
MSHVGQGFASYDRVTEEVEGGCEYEIQTRTRMGQMLLFLAGARLLKFVEIM